MEESRAKAEALTAEAVRALVTRVLDASAAPPDLDTPLTLLGMDSITATEISAVLSREFALNLCPTLPLRHTTVRSLAACITSLGRGECDEPVSA